MRHAARIPEHMICQHDDEGKAAEDVTLGKPLNSRMTAYLQTALDGMTLDELEAQLEDIDSRMARAWELRKRRTSVPEIAHRLGCSRRTVYRLLATALAFMQPALELQEDTYEARAHRLGVSNPDALAVCEMMDYGWSQDAIANQMGLTLDQVKKRASAGRQALRTPNWRNRREMMRLIRIADDPATDVPTEVMVERRMREEAS